MTAPSDRTFLEPPQTIAPPGSGRRQSDRAFQGIPSLAIAPGGRLWATWYAGKTPAEDKNNYVVLATSGDGGESWREVLTVDPDGEGPVRAFDPELWTDPDGRLWSFWAQAIGHDGSIAGVWSMSAADPDREQPQWSAPRRLTDGVMMCKPLVLSSGEWLLPASTWRKTDHSARVVASEDRGETWTVRGGCDVPEADRSYDEHLVIERRDGSLWMLLRTRYGIGESISTDRGRTWGPVQPSALPHTSSRFFIRRLASGNLLLVKHGGLSEKSGRSHLTAYLSHDDGQSWESGLLLDEREGISYPDGQQAADGTIHIIYDYSRKEEMCILLARFTEADIATGAAGADAVLRHPIASAASA